MAECLIACGDLIFWYIIGSFFHHLPSLPLNWFMLPLVTTASGSAFQSFTTLWLNVLRLTRLLHCVFCTLIVWPLVLTSLRGLTNFFSSILSMLFMILYVCITSALLRLYSVHYTVTYFARAQHYTRANHILFNNIFPWNRPNWQKTKMPVINIIL